MRSGAQRLVRHVGIARAPLDPVGQVVGDGELWRARAAWDEDLDGALGTGDRVVVDGVDGLTLSVRRAEEWELGP